MPTTCANPAVNRAGKSEMIRAIRHAWVAGELDDVAVREVTELAFGPRGLALELVAASAITPADHLRCDGFGCPTRCT